MNGQKRGAAAERLSFLSVFHALVFLLLSAAAVGLGVEDARQLFFALSAPYHFGGTPRLLPLLGALLGAACPPLLLWFFLRRARVPLWVSALAVAGILCGVFGLRGEDSIRRNHHAANLDVLAAAQQFQRRQIDLLQQKAELPLDVATWRAALASMQLPLSPVRTRSFERLPFQLEQVKDPAAPLDSFRPGTLVFWVSEDGVEFSLRAIGFDEQGRPAPLRDESGKEVVMTGAFNPNMKEESKPKLAPDRLPALMP